MSSYQKLNYKSLPRLLHIFFKSPYANIFCCTVKRYKNEIWKLCTKINLNVILLSYISLPHLLICQFRMKITALFNVILRYLLQKKSFLVSSLVKVFFRVYLILHIYSLKYIYIPCEIATRFFLYFKLDYCGISSWWIFKNLAFIVQNIILEISNFDYD